MKKKYLLIGASSRSIGMFIQPIMHQFADQAEIVGIFDNNPLRIEAVKKLEGITCPSYTDLRKMFAEVQADCTIVTTVDRYHHEHIVATLEAGMDVITEKPMTIDAEKCKAILDAEKRTGRKVTVTFNYRFAPYATSIKEAVSRGAIGEVLNVDFEYFLDTSHGADYFRRWHRQKKNSGGLLVHKATHHFDLVNWWIDEEPRDVMAYGSRRFYGPTRDEKGERCTTCKFGKDCKFYFDLRANPTFKAIYADCEQSDGYFRDRCVFSSEIDIEDTMSVNVKYSNGALLSYSLIAHSPFEGWKATINGTKGRLEAAEYHSGLSASDPVLVFTIYDREGRKITHEVPKSSGGHGGGDERLQQMILCDDLPDPLNHKAGSFAGAVSILIGIAANKSILDGRNVKINELISLDDYRPSLLNELIAPSDSDECEKTQAIR